jgi:hypothetical protein
VKILIACNKKSECLKYSISSTLVSSSHNEPIIIGNAENDTGRCQTIANDFGSKDILRFRSKYSHRSTNPYKFELFCIERWFAIRDYVAGHDEPVFVMDSDVMVFCDIGAEYAKFSGVDFTVTDPGGSWNVSQGISYWANATILEAFCKFIFKLYEDMNCSESREYFGHFEELQAQRRPGGCCDMNISELFSKRSGLRFHNTTDIVAGSTFDHNICMDYHGYAHDGRSKVFTWKDGQPYCVGPKGNIRFNVVHCIGKEQQMPWFYKEQIR